MYKKPSKKQLLVRRIIVFIVMIVSILVIVTGTILFILGYRLDSINGRLEQGALLQFDSLPTDARITIDGVPTGLQTPAKRSVLAGAHSFLLERDGYKDWAKSLTLQAGTLTWLDYVRLVPEELRLTSEAEFDSVAAVKASPDLQTIVVQQNQTVPSFDLIDIRDTEVQSSVFEIPATVFTDAGVADIQHRFEVDSWDEEGRHILVQHFYRDTNEWLVIDTEDVESSINITRLLSIAFSDIQFASTNGNVLYGLTDGVLRKLDLSNATISRALVTNVESFDMYETNILTYVGANPERLEESVAGVYRDGDEQPRTLRQVEDATPLAIDTSRYFNDTYVAIAEGLTVSVYRGSYPTASQADTSSLRLVEEFTMDAAIDRLTFSPNGDYVLAQSGLSFKSYEVEYDRLNSARIETSETQAHRLQWLDGAYLWAVYDGHLSMREYDGTNVHVIMDVEPGFDATLSQNGRYFYGMTKQEDGRYSLQRATMILN